MYLIYIQDFSQEKKKDLQIILKERKLQIQLGV